MSAQLIVRSAGAYASLQDGGRRGWRRYGVPWAGALDLRLLRLANALVGNPPDAPGIEALDGGLELEAAGEGAWLAVAGAARLVRIGAGGPVALAAWESFRLAPGERMRIRAMEAGRLAMVAVAGLRLQPVLGSCATDARAGLGGLDGRVLGAGSVLPVTAPGACRVRCLPCPPRPSAGPIRLVWGPQAGHFSDAARATLLTASYRVGFEADRMGLRLEGPALEHVGAREIVSDATVPGAIQVPGNGQPIVLLADAQTVGGYPKIATVASADLGRLADLPPGHVVHFAAVTVAEAETLARAAEAGTRALLATIRPPAGRAPDSATLLTLNLIDGVVSAWDDGAPSPPVSRLSLS